MKANISVIYESLAFLLQAGINLISAIELLKKNAKDKSMKKVLNILSKELNKGFELEDVFQKYPKIFGATTYIYIKSSNKRGNLPEILLKLSHNINNKAKIKTQIIQSLSYPILMLIATFIITIVMFTTIIPQTALQIQSISNGELPKVTMFLLNISALITKNSTILITLLFIFASIIIAFVKFYRQKFDKFVTNIPIFGDIMKNIDIVNIYSNLANLFSAEINQLEATTICADGIANRYISYTFRKSIVANLNKGMSFSQAVAKYNLINSIDAICIYSAEQCGNLDMMLNKLATKIEEETNRKIKNISSIIEPIITIFLGALIGTIALAVYLPIFQMQNI